MKPRRPQPKTGKNLPDSLALPPRNFSSYSSRLRRRRRRASLPSLSPVILSSSLLSLTTAHELSTGAVARLILSDDNLRMEINELRSSKLRAWRVVETIYGEINDIDIFATSGS
ncbi:hypothetical protein Drorol1_Dr00022125 [Drosera rotundifolia]